MTRMTASFGTCPACGADIARIDVLIEYEADGEPAAYAECPDCREVVDPLHPESRPVETRREQTHV